MDFGIEILSTSAETLKFVLTNCDTTFANTLRRVMIAEVPTMAIHIVNLYDNTSVLNDEFICHRLGLLPLVSEEAQRYNYSWMCGCKEPECQKCKVPFQLSVKNNDYQIVTVTSMHLKEASEINSREYAVRPVTFMSKVRPGEEVGVPLLKLSTGQSVHIKCEAQKGIGKMHAKWSPVAVANYIPEPDVQIEEDKLSKLTLAQMKQISEACPRDVFAVNAKYGILEVVQPLACIYCNECKVKATEFEVSNLVTVKPKKDRFIFTVQGTGALKPTTILRQALNILKLKLEALESNILKQQKCQKVI